MGAIPERSKRNQILDVFLSWNSQNGGDLNVEGKGDVKNAHFSLEPLVICLRCH